MIRNLLFERLGPSSFGRGPKPSRRRAQRGGDRSGAGYSVHSCLTFQMGIPQTENHAAERWPGVFWIYRGKRQPILRGYRYEVSIILVAPSERCCGYNAPASFIL